MEQQNSEGTLFDSIIFKSKNDVYNLIENLDSTQSLYMITKALEFSYKSGIFSMEETELISKSLRILNSEYLKNND